MEDMLLLLIVIVKAVIVRMAAAGIAGAVVGGLQVLFKHGLHVDRLQKGMMAGLHEGLYLGAIWGFAIVAQHNIVEPLSMMLGVL